MSPTETHSSPTLETPYTRDEALRNPLVHDVLHRVVTGFVRGTQAEAPFVPQKVVDDAVLGLRSLALALAVARTPRNLQAAADVIWGLFFEGLDAIKTKRPAPWRQRPVE